MDSLLWKLYRIEKKSQILWFKNLQQIQIFESQDLQVQQSLETRIKVFCHFLLILSPQNKFEL